MATKTLLLLLVAATAAFAADDVCSGTVTVTGQGSQTATPDIAKVYLSVQSTKDSAAEARDEAAAAAVNVIDAVGAIEGITQDDITTLDVSVSPQYSYDDKGNANINGYIFSQRLQVKVTNLTNDVLGTVIDTAVKTGGNLVVIESIQAELSPAVKKEATDAARTAAVDDAIATSQLLAKASGVTLGAIKSLTDNPGSSPQPYPIAGYAADSKIEAAPSTPINIGTTDVTASVEMQVAIC